MNFPEIQTAIQHLQKTSKCLHCRSKYNLDNINVVATTKLEGLFEMTCPNCHAATIVTVLLTPEMEIRKKKTNPKQGKISHDDILDIKNFLSNFDGNFKRIFSKNNK